MVKHTTKQDPPNEEPPSDPPAKNQPAPEERKREPDAGPDAKHPVEDAKQPVGAPAPAAQASTPLAAVEAEMQKAADEGKPDPLAQSKISGAAGAHGDLVTELSKLPPIAALDGLKANAAAGYYRGVPKDELIATLKGLPFEDESSRVQRDWLVQRAESGEFSRG